MCTHSGRSTRKWQPVQTYHHMGMDPNKKHSLTMTQHLPCFTAKGLRCYQDKRVKFEAPTAATVKFAAFWDMTPHSLVDHYLCFTWICCFCLQGR